MSAAQPKKAKHVECCRQFGANDDDMIEHPCQLNDRTILGWLTCIEVKAEFLLSKLFHRYYSAEEMSINISLY